MIGSTKLKNGNTNSPFKDKPQQFADIQLP